MRAVLSGRAALALLNEGDSWYAMSYEDPERLVPCEPSEANVLLRDVHDRIWLKDVSVEQVRNSLADVVDSTEALDCVLYLLDGSLKPETRDVVALEFEELALWPEIVQEVAVVLLAHPLPPSADIVGAIAACARTASRQSLKLLRELHSVQVLVKHVHDAWLQIDIDRFGGVDERDVAEAHFIKHGVFAALVRHEFESAKPTALQGTILSNFSLICTLAEMGDVIHDWLRLLKDQNSVVDVPAFAAEVGDTSCYNAFGLCAHSIEPLLSEVAFERQEKATERGDRVIYCGVDVIPKSGVKFFEDANRVNALRFPKQRILTYKKHTFDSALHGAIVKNDTFVVTMFRVDLGLDHNVIPVLFLELLGAKKTQITERYNRTTREVDQFVNVAFVLRDCTGGVAIWEAEARIQPATEKRSDVILGRPLLIAFDDVREERDETILCPKTPFPGQLGYWIYI